MTRPGPSDIGYSSLSHRYTFHWIVLFGLFLSLCYGLSRFYYVGATHDDANYLLSAQSLLQGRYVMLDQPHEPRMTTYPPGWPLVLAPFTTISNHPWWLLRCLTALFAIFSCWVLRALIRAPSDRWVSALFILHPLILVYGMTLMSDVFFVFLTLITLLALDRELKAPSSWNTCLLIVSLAYTVFTRTVGIFLLPAVLVGLGVGRRWKTATLATVMGLIAVSVFPLRNYLTGSHPMGSYAATWNDSFLSLAHLYRVIPQTWDVLQAFLINDFLVLPWTTGVVRGVLALALLTFVGAGIYRQCKASRAQRGFAVAAGLYMVFLVLLHGLWKGREPRYAMPLIPFLLVFGIEGYHEAVRHRATFKKPLLGVAIVLCMLGLYVRGYAHLLQQTRALWDNGTGRPAQETFQWIHQHLPTSAILLYPKPAELFLYTQRKAVAPVRARDAMQFRWALLQDGITHVLVKPVALDDSGPASPQRDWNANQFWTSTWPDAFQTIYENPSEKTVLFAVRPSSHFAPVYQSYQLAQLALEKGDVEKAFANYAKALRSDPTLLPVLVRYVELALSTRKHLPEARAYLKNASPSLADHPVLNSLRARSNGDGLTL